jgi:ABC-2 type transport system ATP-binding protein
MKTGDIGIACQKLSKRYKGSDIYALHDLDLTVKAGEVYGFLGPNGAGKSTTIRTLMNFIQPTSGSATILGKDIVNDSVDIKRSVGYLSSDMAMYPKMTGRQFLDYMSELQPATNKSYRKELAKRFKTELDKRLGDLSRGNRQKVGIVQAFMHQPDVLILDEPSSGLDPLMQEEFYALLKESKQRAAAIFVSSHILSEVQKMCDRVGIIRDGKLIVERDIAEMAKEAAHTFDITFVGKPPVAQLRMINGVTVPNHDDNNVTVHVHGDLSPLLKELSQYDVTRLNARQLDLEEMFMRFYSGKAS